MIRKLKEAGARARDARKLHADLSSAALIVLGGTIALRDAGDRTGRFQFARTPFEARPADWSAVEEVLLSREYSFINALLGGRRSPVVIDAGANIGTFALFVFSLAPDAFVLSIEPSDRTFRVLDRNLRANDNHDWRAMNVALARGKGTVRFSNRMASTGSRIADDGDQDVTTVGLEDLLQVAGGRVDLCKVDIEGAECDALQGREDVLRAIESLVIELHPGRCDDAALMRTLRSRYKYVYVVPGRASTKPLLCATDEKLRLPLFGE